MYDNTSRVIEVDINEILPNRFQPRIQFDEEEILELSDSIKEHGVIQPLVVRTIGDKYEIIAGERRYKASVLAGKETVPVIVKNLNDKDSAEIALIENIQRKNLTPIEEALSYKKILDMGYITQENLASKLGKSQSAVANKIRLLNLSDEVQEALLENRISERHARSLLKLTITKQQNEMLNRIIAERLTVRRADEEIEKLKNNIVDDSNDDTQKIIEKGEIDMNNNNMFGMPNIPQNSQVSTSSFDIFGTGMQQPITSQSANESIPEPLQQPVITQAPNFDIFGTGTTYDNKVNNGVGIQMPTMPEVSTMNSTGLNSAEKVNEAPIFSMPTVPEVSTMNSTGLNSTEMVNEAPTFSMPTVPEVSTMNSTGLNSTEMVNEAPTFSMPTVPEVSTMNSTGLNSAEKVNEAPTFSMPTVPEVSTMDSTGLNSTEKVNEAPIFSMPTVPEVSTMDSTGLNSTEKVNEAPIFSMPTVPQTAPIIESPVVNTQDQMIQQSENLFSFGNNNMNTVVSQQPETKIESTPEFKMPEPIIVTDYSKQYDPVMPQTAPVAPTVDFKQVINAIRECSSKIEQYGFKIDVEEYDLANLYQVIFKIEK